MTTDLILSQRERRLATANRVKLLDDVSFPHLQYWNYSACAHHTEIGPQVDCVYRACGGDLFSHQRVGASWLYAAHFGLLADDTGVGKTNEILALIALLKQSSELYQRALLIPNSPAVKQWASECARWIPGIKVIAVNGDIPKPRRIELYSSDFDVLIAGIHIAINDRAELERLAPFDLVASDDVDPLLDSSNASHRAIVALSRNATRSFTVNATVLQTRLTQVHSALVPAGGYDVFGDLNRFESRFVRKENVTEFVNGKKKKRRIVTGTKNTEELKEKFKGMYLRRKATELTDVRMPMLMPPVVEWFDLTPLQREKYTELQEGVLRILREEGESVKHLTALTQWLYGQQICAGMPALGEPDGPYASPKLDWLFNRLSTEWQDRKTIVFVKNVGMVRAALSRARELEIGAAMIWGQKQNSEQREAQKNKFWQDPDCKFLIGTTALERSHNLQVANTVVNLDTHLNPARMHQILGRSRRAGSPHDRVFVFTLLTRDTQEETYMQVLQERQALADNVFDETNELYEALPPFQLLRMMTP